VGLSSAGVCNKCFGGYTLNTASNTCDPSLTCNTGSTCTVCPRGYTLASGVCTACTLPANCVACSSTSSTTCIKCSTGFYLDASNVCQTCSTNCAACDSSTFCTTASAGYYVRLAADGSASGVVAQCYKLCATCVDSA
jgi:proprotein convertase subtilisin/kexin type 5